MRLSTKVAMILCLLIPSNAYAMHFKTDTGLEFNTEKVAYVTGILNAQAAMQYQRTSLDTAGMSGDRIVVIDSQGGYVPVGQDILRMMNAERATGTRIVCLVTRQASSMAFNILTFCDVKLAVEKSHMLVHKIRSPIKCAEGCTGAMLRAAAASLDASDEPYRQANAKAMHMTLTNYDLCADNETVWTGTTLRSMGYLDGIATIVK